MGESKEPSPRFVEGREAEAQERFADAEIAYRSIGQDDPAYPSAQLRLGILSARVGQNDAARLFFHRVLEFNPSSAEALEWLASFARRDGLLVHAIFLYRRAASVEPRNLRLWFGLADCYLESWDLEMAVEGFRRILDITPGMAQGHDRLGVALWRQGELELAIEEFQTAIRLAPELTPSYANLIQLYTREGRLKEADFLAAEAQKIAKGSYEKLIDFAGAFLAVKSMKSSEQAFRQASSLKPESVEPKFHLGRLLQMVGRFQEAEVVFRSLIEHQPNWPQPYVELIRSRKCTVAERPLLGKMHELVRQPELPLDLRQALHYALGKAYDDLAEYGTALKHYDEANGLALARVPPGLNNRANLTANTTRIIETFTPKLMAEFKGVGSSSTAPIFILGMIRSGTTLTEQILSSHPMVGAAGELSYLMEHAGEVLNPSLKENREKLIPLAEGYLRRLHFEVSGKERVTDKMPANLMIAGLLHILFPNARILLCDRNVLDVSLSAYVTPHETPQAFLHSADNLAFHYAQHVRLTEHWKKVIPSDRLMTVHYEDLVAETEPTVRGIVEFLDLPWDDACLRHQNNPRLIQTPSIWQVRQGMYKSSVDRWRNYEPWIADLKRSLKAEGLGGLV